MTDLLPRETASPTALSPSSARAKPPSIDTDFPDDYLARKAAQTTQAKKKVAYEFTLDAGLLHQYYRLREDMFISVWGLQHFSGVREAYDDISHVMVARQGLQCVAGGRLTVASPGNPRLLPMEKRNLKLKDLFPDLYLAERCYGEFSRLAILPEFRAGAIFPEMARRFIRKAIAEGVEYAFNMAPLPLARNYRQAMQSFGLKWDIRYDITVPERDEYEGIKMVVSVMDLTSLRRSPFSQTKMREVLPAQ